ncbi:uncharacterized protein LOC128212511 isoform X2 [Mya arenaria]|uniref:uncharacterized protein LOC128212511 isoform X2 n=1 Tax=Mya arenaria TaxID=6604 RepID=UPI0022E323FB|nr:uncharacterized protein LOC128212511 isoform X2 [Mya arenaria]
MKYQESLTLWDKSGIETLVEELCSRLKDSEIQATVSPAVKSRSCSSEGSDDSGTENQNPAQKYYAAFPALQGSGTSCNQSPTETVWGKNPIVSKTLASEEDSSSTNEDAEIRKINRSEPVAVPKLRKPKRNRNRKESQGRNSRGRRDRDRPRSSGNKQTRGKQSQKEQRKLQEFPNWPPGFAKLDQAILQNLGYLEEDFVFLAESPKRKDDELCTKVESLLKGILLPAPAKTYKELEDVDDELPEEMLKTGKVSKPQPKPTADTAIDNLQTIYVKSDAESQRSSAREDNVSPELQEQEIWYTQPINAVFQNQECETANTQSSKLRLYKRNSYPDFSTDEQETKDSWEDLNSPSSSPQDGIFRTFSAASNSSDDIFDGSVLIPAWLTEVISADENSDDEIDLSASLKSSSPFPSFEQGHARLANSVKKNESFEQLQNSWKEGNEFTGSFYQQDLGGPGHDQHFDENSTPTPDNAYQTQGGERPISVSLVDLDYMAKFLEENSSSDWHSFSPEDQISLPFPVESSGSSGMWQSQVLVDYTLYSSHSETNLPLLTVLDLQCWQPLGASPYSPLWDVNMQKRNKFSPWGGQLVPGDSQIWLGENTLVFMYNVNADKQDDSKADKNENTLIPRISIDIVSDADNEGSAFMDKDDHGLDNSHAYHFYDRSVSMGDVPSLWDDHESPKKSDPKLSKSFELVPSEHSAFNDVPRKLIQVHSEPNLVQFRQDFIDNGQDTTQSPKEHLFFSPKTHFRPITPAFAPELFTSASKSKQQVCHDLFGGMPSTKTPYQQYNAVNDDSDEESFVPSFKLKNYSKCIQTGESFDKVDSPEVLSGAEERDTPEALTLSIIEDIMGENDDRDRLIPINEDLDTANTDSAYETDYGCNQGADNDSDRVAEAFGGSKCHPCSSFGQLPQRQLSSDGAVFDFGHQGDLVDFKVESFMATFPHTQDWPDSCMHHASVHNDIWADTHKDSSTCQTTVHNDIWKDKHNDSFTDQVSVHNDIWKDSQRDSCNQPASVHSDIWKDSLSHKDGCHIDNWASFDQVGEKEKLNESQISASFPGTGHGFWQEDIGLDHLYKDDIEKYRNIWSTAGQEYLSVDIALPEEQENPCKFYPEYCEEQYDNVSPDNIIFHPMYLGNLEGVIDAENEINDERTAGDVKQVEGSCNFELDYDGFVGFPECNDTCDGCDQADEETCHQPGDYFSVKLVYRDKEQEKADPSAEQHHSYGSYDLAPMPEAVTLSELESEWLDTNLLWAQKKPSSSQRKPCSFYLEGNCRRADCKFAHDISNITCRFWEEGGCFKGPLCPFLHGYPRQGSPVDDVHLTPIMADDDRESFDLNSDEFPELSLSVKNTNNNNSSSTINQKKSKPLKSQNASVGKTERNRRGNLRRHSNKENRCEINIVAKCSSSV